MKQLLIALALAFSVAPNLAHAQPAEALGHPLPSGDLPAGTVQVKIIAGSIAKPVADTDVHISIGGVDHPARTNAEGHATLPGVPAGAKVQIKVKGPKDDITSDEFPMPDQGGVKVMLSTAPMEAQPGPMGGGGGGGGDDGGGGGGGGPMMGPGGRPEPRLMSGKGRPDQTVGAGMLIATVTYDDLAAKDPPVDVPVIVIGYSDEKGVTGHVEKTDASGRAVFKGLDRSGATAYFVMTRLPRFDGTAAVIDRLETIPPIELGATAGWRVMMAGEKRDSKKPAVDELAKVEAPAEVAAGKVLVSVAGVPQPGMSAQLVDALTGKIVATAPLAPETPKNLKAQTSPLQVDPQAAAGSLGVQLARSAGGQTVPVPGAKVRIHAVVGDAVIGEATAAKDGYASFDKLPTGQAVAVEVVMGDQTVRSTAMTVPADKGQQVTLMLTWDQRGELSATFDLPEDLAGPASAFYVQTAMFKKTYRSEPFQPVPGKGTAASILVYPRVFLQFALDASAEDDYLAVRGEMAVRNFSWAPYRGGEDGLSIPLPDGFKGAGVMEESEVAKDTDGYRVLHPIPPFGLTFHIGFSLPIHGEETDWDMPLPIGLFEGDLAVKKFPASVTVSPPTDVPGLHSEEVKNEGSTYFVMHDLTLMPRPDLLVPHLRFSISGLPSPPTWKVLAPKIAGLIVVALVLLAGFVAIGAAARAGRARATETAARKQRIDALYERLVAIDQAGGDDAKRASVVAELEQLLAAERERTKG